MKFKDYLVPIILSGSKVVTWQLFNDKNLEVGDELLFVNSDSGTEFAKAEITEVREKRLSDINEEDFEDGHERYKSQKDIFTHYRGYYGDKVKLNSVVKIVKFKLNEKISTTAQCVTKMTLKD